jgi:hypothetical protein
MHTRVDLMSQAFPSAGRSAAALIILRAKGCVMTQRHHRSGTCSREPTRWVNRLIGDAQPSATKLSFTAAQTYEPNAPLRPSGLIGPVTLSTR